MTAHRPRVLAAALLALALCCALTAASAQAKTVSVSGIQTVVDEENGIYKMRVHYEVRGPLLYNLEYIATFDKSVPLVNGPG